MTEVLAPIAFMAMTGGIAVLGHYPHTYSTASKRAVDLALGGLALVLGLPILAVCALMVKLSSRGPLLFSQIRVGKNGKLFRMYKFRTMTVDAESDTGAVWATRKDPRVIPACRWMRISHMDELPQIFHVLAGTMSLVGPRPERPCILAELEDHYPNVRERLAVKPGITGLAQVRNGYDSSIESFRHKLAADLEYIEGVGVLADLKIMFLTVTKVYDRKAC